MFLYTSATSAFPFAAYLLVFYIHSKLAHSQCLSFEKYQIKLRQVLGELCLNLDKQFDKTLFLIFFPGSQLCFQAPCLGTRTMHMHLPCILAPMFPAVRFDSPQTGSWGTRACSLPWDKTPQCFCGLQLQGRKSGVLPLGQRGLCLLRS